MFGRRIYTILLCTTLRANDFTCIITKIHAVVLVCVEDPNEAITIKNRNDIESTHLACDLNQCDLLNGSAPIRVCSLV